MQFETLEVGGETTILVVDDQPSNVILVNEAVRGLGKVLFTTSGSAAMDMARKSPPDIVLLDIEMPGMDGFDVCKAMKTDPLLADIPVIFITSHSSNAQELEALRLGGVDFLSKPINLPVARARIQTHLTLRAKSKALVQARRDLEDVVHNLPAFVGQWDNALTCIFSNDVEGQWFGVASKDIGGRHVRDVIGPTAYANFEPYIQAALRGSNPSFEITLLRVDGRPLYAQVSLVCRSPIKLDAGFLMLITDLTERKEAELALHDEKERLRITLNSIGDAVIATNHLGEVTFLNPIAESMTGWYSKEVIGAPIETIMPLRSGTSGHTLQNPIRLALSEQRTVGMALDCTLVRRDGREFDVEDSAAPIKDQNGNITGAIIVFHDVSEARAMAVKMTHLANHDALTNLPNRMLLQDRTEQAISSARREHKHVALFILDLDHFKTINDSIGHSTGDKLLQQVAARLKVRLRGNDTVSRQGGDEFVVLSPNLDDLESVAILAEDMLKLVSAPFVVDGASYHLSVSIGISLFPDDSEDMEALYRHSDAAMYRAKQDGRNRFRFFSADIEDALKAKHALTRQIREALELRQFEVHYQPKVDAAEGKIVGAEALVRWRNSEGQLVPPAQFIPLCEETGLIIALGTFVLREACTDAVEFIRVVGPIRMAVNVSVLQIADPGFISTVQQIIQDTGIRPNCLELEITEGVLAGDMEKTLQTLTALKALGVSIAIDDFGTGYSSLTYLKRFPIDVLKIDQSFIRDMLLDRSDAGIVEAIVQMAHSLGLRLVAEGVEEIAQAQCLLAIGCQIMQGYLYSRPISKLQFFDLLDPENGKAHLLKAVANQP